MLLWSEVCVLLGFYTAKMVDFSVVVKALRYKPEGRGL